MFEYTAEQKTLEIGGIKVGGSPGKTPTVLIGSIFYNKDKLVRNREAGEFEKKETEELLVMLSEMTEKTGIPTMLDVVATTETAMERYLLSLVDMTEFPLLIDGCDSVEVNTKGIEVAEEGGFLDRIVLNSLTPETKEELWTAVRQSKLKNVVLLTFDSKSLTSTKKRVELADDLVQRAKGIGLENLLIDTGVMDLPTLGIACKTQHILKSKYGYPVGNGAHNAISTWAGLVPKFGKRAKAPAMVGASLMPVSLGADFVLIGPAKHAPIVYPSVAMIDVALSGMLIEDRIKPERPHPRFLIS
ncbi:MAG: tetrahydromethanopterin S-methyltransferase subunit H [Promethearchaeota archaeon]